MKTMLGRFALLGPPATCGCGRTGRSGGLLRGDRGNGKRQHGEKGGDLHGRSLGIGYITRRVGGTMPSTDFSPLPADVYHPALEPDSMRRIPLGHSRRPGRTRQQERRQARGMTSPWFATSQFDLVAGTAWQPRPGSRSGPGGHRRPANWTIWPGSRACSSRAASSL